VRQGLLRPYADIFGPRGRQWLAELLLPEVMRLQVDHWLALVDTYGERIKAVEVKLYQELARQERWAADIALLRTMPGVGPVTALTILAELGDYRRFRRRSSVSCFAGLIPSSKRSDQSCRYGSITKRGSRALRSILVEVSLNAAARVPRYGALYQQLKTARRSSNVGKVAVARQMLEDAWTMLIKREPFRFMPVQAENLTQVG
jgi:transposase